MATSLATVGCLLLVAIAICLMSKCCKCCKRNKYSPSLAQSTPASNPVYTSEMHDIQDKAYSVTFDNVLYAEMETE